VSIEDIAIAASIIFICRLQESKTFSLKIKGDLVMACHNPPLKKSKEPM